MEKLGNEGREELQEQGQQRTEQQQLNQQQKQQDQQQEQTGQAQPGREEKDSFFEDNDLLEAKRAAELLESLGLDEGGDDDEAGAPRDASATVRNLWGAAEGMRWRFVLAVVAVIVYAAASVWATSYSAQVFDVMWDDIQAATDEGRVYVMTWDTGGRELASYLGIWTLATVGYAASKLIMASFSEKLNLKLRKQIVAKLNRLPLSYFDNERPGEIVSRATNDLDKLSESLQDGLMMLITSIASVAGGFIAMFYINVQLTGIFLVFTVISVVLTQVISKQTLRYAGERQHWVGVLTAAVEEAYSGRLVTRAFNQEQYSSAQIHALSDKLAEASRKADFMTNLAMPIVRFLMRFSQVFIMVMAGQMLVAGTMTVGTFQAYFQYVTLASEPLAQFSLQINTLQNGLAAVERVFDLLAEPEMEPEAEEPLTVPADSPGAISFEHVRFGYAPEKTLMRDVSFDVRPGQKIAIVGQTGAGKTTLVNLLMRFYEIDGGRITLDGVDTHQMTRADLRSNFGMVLQDAWLFDGTIAENIAYGRPDATREEIVAAAKMARVDFFVRTMPQGYDTHVGNDAENVSQGQRQLLTIARVILCDPKILILDEATSSVDTRTEQDITRAMQTLMAGRTTFVIAHRLSTIVDSDLILLMDGGSIIEQGTHKELLAKHGAYWELYQSQFA